VARVPKMRIVVDGRATADGTWETVGRRGLLEKDVVLENRPSGWAWPAAKPFSAREIIYNTRAGRQLHSARRGAPGIANQSQARLVRLGARQTTAICLSARRAWKTYYTNFFSTPKRQRHRDPAVARRPSKGHVAALTDSNRTARNVSSSPPQTGGQRATFIVWNAFQAAKTRGCVIRGREKKPDL